MRACTQLERLRRLALLTLHSSWDALCCLAAGSCAGCGLRSLLAEHPTYREHLASSPGTRASGSLLDLHLRPSTLAGTDPGAWQSLSPAVCTQMRHIGQYATEEEAARSFDAAALEVFGNHSSTPQNFPSGEAASSQTSQQDSEAPSDTEVSSSVRVQWQCWCACGLQFCCCCYSGDWSASDIKGQGLCSICSTLRQGIHASSPPGPAG